MDEKLKKILPWIPLAIAAGYFVFLIATWHEFITSQQRIREQFDFAVDKWMREKDAPRTDES